MIIHTILNIIGLILQVLGALLLAVSSVSKESYPYVIKLFLWISRKFSEIQGKQFPARSKTWFFEGILKDILGYIGSQNVEPRGFRFTIGVCLILFGFLIQLFSYIFLLVSFTGFFWLLVFGYLGVLAIHYKVIIRTITDIRTGFDKVLQEERSARKKLIGKAWMWFSGFFIINLAVFLEIMRKLIPPILKMIRWMLSIGIPKSERERIKEDAFREFESKYAEEWARISENLFADEDKKSSPDAISN